jgi:hypothetical protein
MQSSSVGSNSYFKEPEQLTEQGSNTGKPNDSSPLAKLMQKATKIDFRNFSYRLHQLYEKSQKIISRHEEQKIMKAEVHFIGRTNHSPHSLHLEEEGKELWQGRYGFEAIQINTTDDNGNPKELHVYADTLQNTYKEWMDRKSSGEIKEYTYADWESEISTNQPLEEDYDQSYEEWLLENESLDDEFSSYSIIDDLPVAKNESTEPKLVVRQSAEAWLAEKNKDVRFDRYVQNRINPDSDGNIPDPKLRKLLIENNVRFFTDKELQSVKATFDKDGIKQISLKSIDLDPNDTQQKQLAAGRYAFVIGIERGNSDERTEALYLSPKITINEGDKQGKIQHSSFLRSGKVASAGMIEVNDQGKIEKIVQYSGHYLPTQKEMVTALDFLKSKMTTTPKDQEEFNQIRLSINKYTGLMLMATMGINTLAEKFAGKKLDLGMVDVNASEWLKAYHERQNMQNADRKK